MTSKIVDLHQTNIDIRGSGDNQLRLEGTFTLSQDNKACPHVIY
jgi:hypothetical protein